MDQLLKRQLQAIAENKHSGANELALQAVGALRSWIRRNQNEEVRGYVRVFRALLEMQPEMAPFLRLANEVALAADSTNPAKTLLRSCRRMQNILKQGPGLIARRFQRALGGGPRKTILTYSYSSTVLRALIHSKSQVLQVYCSEASPEMERRTLARRLASAGLHVTLTTDLSLPSFIHGVDDAHPRPDAVLVGADQVRPTHFVNRYGTEILAKAARRARVPVWVLTDTTKFIGDWRRDSGSTRTEPATLLWRNAPKRVTPWLRLLGEVPLAPHVKVLTERGWMTSEQVRQAIREIHLSARMITILRARD
jgi:translation initiation factor 2B subunit (eIF-2B alpha/beta/delta family)